MEEIAVPRLEAPTLKVFNDKFFASQTPVILRGAANDWPARKLWDRDYLKNIVGPAVLTVERGPNGVHPDLTTIGLSGQEQVSFSEYVDAIWSGDEVAKTRFVIGDKAAILNHDGQTPGEHFGPLMGDVIVPPFFDRKALRFIGFWLSARGVLSWLHYDNDGLPHLNAQVKGRKRVVLYPPGQAALLYPFLYTGDEGGTYSQFSQVDVEEPDLRRFPAFARAQRFAGMLEEGDMLFIPPLWYHSFRHLDPININVNFSWRSGRLALNGISARNRFWAALRRSFSDGKPSSTPGETLAAIGGLSPEVRSLLQNLEKHILDPSGSASAPENGAAAFGENREGAS
jgi:lysine-specific demethylase 8